MVKAGGRIPVPQPTFLANWLMCSMRFSFIILVTILLVACGGASVPSADISRETFGDLWPFTVEQGQLQCLSSTHLVFIADGLTYAVNGTAKGSGKYRDIEPIRSPDPSDTRYPMSLQPVLDIGLPLCR